MSLVREERVMVWIECDSCGARIRSAPDIAKSGWKKYGQITDSGVDRFYACPKCWEAKL